MTASRETWRRGPETDEHPCSRCGGKRDRPGQRYCRACHADYCRDVYSVRRRREREHYKALIAALNADR